MDIIQNPRFFIGLLVMLLLGGSIQVVGAADDYQFVGEWGDDPAAAVHFNSPWAVAIDRVGNIYVSEQFGGWIYKFTSTGTFLTKWRTWGFGNSWATGPDDDDTGIAIDSGNNLYTSSWNAQVRMWNSNGTFLTSWGTHGSGDGQLGTSGGLAIDSAGNVYVADIGNYRILKFTSDGIFLTSWGTRGSGDGEPYMPVGITVDGSGNVYVVDSKHSRIQKFNSYGTPLTEWGTLGSGDGQFGSLTGIAVDTAGNVYIADSGNRWIQKFKSDGTFVTKFGTEGSGDGQFGSLHGIAVDIAGNIYVVDSNRIQKFAPATPTTVATTIPMPTPTPKIITTVATTVPIPTITPEVTTVTTTATPIPTSVFRFTPSPLTIPRGSTNTITLYLDGLKNGISGFNISLGLSLVDPTIGEIVGVSLPGWTMQKNSALPADTIWLTALDTAGISEPGILSARIGTVTIRGDRAGQTEVCVIQARVDDDSGNRLSPQLVACPVAVTDSRLLFPGMSSAPNDLNGDGRYEDINGNGAPDFNDVVIFFNNIDWITDHEPIAGFDYNWNGQIDFNDVVWLFNQV